MINFALREKKLSVPLPFFPRSVGVNRFRQSGLREDMGGIDAVEICTVSKGECAVEQRGVMVPLGAGQSLYKLPGEHRRKVVLSPDGAEIYWATFDGPGAERFMCSYGYPAGALPTGNCPADLYEQIARNLTIGTETAWRRATALYVELIVRLPGAEPEPNASEQQLSECIQQLRIRFSDPGFNVDALAADMKLHRTTLLRLFRKGLNTTPMDYLLRCRINHAQYLLRTTLMPVSEIAENAGFRQCSYFCRVIRENCGRTPEQYRQSFRMEGFRSNK